MVTPKPRVQGEREETVLRTFGGTVVRVDVVTYWRASCECEGGGCGVFPIVATLSWDDALEAALEHGRLYHS